MLRSLRFSFAVVFAHRNQYQEPCPKAVGGGNFIRSILDCFETTMDGPHAENPCVDDALTMFEGVNPSCIKCVEHFVEDHLMAAISQCPPEYLSSGENRDSCAVSITAELNNDCY